jgi:hypothetical protein
LPAALLHAPLTRPDGTPNRLGQLTLTHCTVLPGFALVAEPSGLQLTAQSSILGTVLTGELVTAGFSDSIVDATSPTEVACAALDGASAGGALSLAGCTVIGKVHTTLLNLVCNSIFWAGLAAADVFPAPLWSDRKQAGCVRFSFLPPNAITPRQFECVEQASFSAQPLFFSLTYGDPGYAKLLDSTPDAVRRGAEDGGEMGAFHFVAAPLRESDLRVRLQEFLPVGMEFGIIYQN